jgi:beta-fructofuranosidase
MEKNNIVRETREKLMQDPYRPAYHFVLPEDIVLGPADPNGAFFADGLYHLMYLYRNVGTDRHQWGHMVSHDLLHWWHRPDCLSYTNGDGSSFSGGAFVDEDKTAYLSYWKLPTLEIPGDFGGIAISYAKPPYDEWKQMENLADVSTVQGIRDAVIDGKVVHLGSADPSNIWKMDGKYYMQYGNKPVLDEYGTGENAEPFYQGGWTELYRSEDLKHWEFVHRFYDVAPNGENDWPDHTEDDMCPSFLPLYDAESGGQQTDKWLQLFIAHNKGCQYFVGTLKDEKFYPEVHGRMSWRDITYFAPEGLIDDQNRHIVWAWIKDNLEDDLERFGWSGVYALPRTLWWEDAMLHMAPAKEIDSLQYNHQRLTIALDGNIPVKNGKRCRIKGTWDGTKAEKVGIKVCVSKDGNEYTEIYLDKKKNKLVVDTTHSGAEGKNRGVEEAPFTLKDGEKLELDIFIDQSVVEVFANRRQAVCRRIFGSKDAEGVWLIGDADAVEKLDSWEMAATNPY